MDPITLAFLIKFGIPIATQLGGAVINNAGQQITLFEQSRVLSAQTQVLSAQAQVEYYRSLKAYYQYLAACKCKSKKKSSKHA